MSACRLVHRLRRVVAATERGRQELIEVLVQSTAQLRTGERLLRDAVRLHGRLAVPARRWRQTP